MSKLSRAVFIILILSVVGIGVIVVYFPSVIPPRIKAGQVWGYFGGTEDNPFKAVECKKRYKILAIKGRFVQYRQVDTGEIDSCSVHYFKLGSQLLEDSQ